MDTPLRTARRLRRAAWVRGATASLSLLVSCAAPPPDEPPSQTLPDVSALPAQAALPDLFTSFFDADRRAETAADFTGWRRDELLLLFSHYVYGHAVEVGGVGAVELAARHENVNLLDDVGEGAGAAVAVDLLELTVTSAAGPALHLALFVPAGASRPVPVVLGPNKCGNHTVVPDERVRESPAFRQSSCGGRGSQSAQWPVADIAAAGFALATFHESDAAPDDVAQAFDAFAQRQMPAADGGAVLSLWAAGNSLALDALTTRAEVDAGSVAVFGHSRRGKAALLTAARDPRFAAVVAHQSGTLGASLLRNDEGEPLELIVGIYPHWFGALLPAFVGVEDRLPVDQHQLLSLVAPRPLLLVDGDADSWADPLGARDAAAAAAPAWELLGARGLGAELQWQTRPGEHSVERSDWSLFLAFLQLQLPR